MIPREAHRGEVQQLGVGCVAIGGGGVGGVCFFFLLLVLEPVESLDAALWWFCGWLVRWGVCG